MENNNTRIAVIGLGYVGLPLARLFATKFPVIGYDINSARIEALKKGHDSTLEVEDEVLQAVLVKNLKKLSFVEEEVFELSGGFNNAAIDNNSGGLTNVTPSEVEGSHSDANSSPGAPIAIGGEGERSLRYPRPRRHHGL